ncbi:hypothetical protein FACS1894151_02870 [Spirochaetia bacterium]|nr:hypothetical protein FACS1894151_02870 [Spirochaetia bacterium]
MQLRFYSFAVLTIFLCFAAPLLPVFSQQAAGQAAMQNYRTGRDLEARGRMDDANSYYNNAVRIAQDEINRNTANADTYAALAMTYQRQKKYADVLRSGDQGLRIFGIDYRVIEIMGEAYFYLDRYPECLQYMQRYVNALPQGDRASVAYFFIGEVYRLTEKWLHADIAITTAVKLEPGIALWWYRLGSVREEAGYYDLAIDAYQQALRLQSNYREASAGLERSRRAGT